MYTEELDLLNPIINRHFSVTSGSWFCFYGKPGRRNDIGIKSFTFAMGKRRKPQSLGQMSKAEAACLEPTSEEQREEFIVQNEALSTAEGEATGCSEQKEFQIYPYSKYFSC